MADELAARVVQWCRTLAACSERPDQIRRTYLSEPMHDVHRLLTGWMHGLNMHVHVDAAGNLRGLRTTGTDRGRKRLLIGSHLDTVPDAGAFDGVLGVVMGIALVEMLDDVALPLDIEVIGFSEEEGVRFGEPFIGSRAVAGTFDSGLLDRRDTAGISVGESIAAFGLDVNAMKEACVDRSAVGYLEFHIEQGPLLDTAGLPVAVVDAMVGSSRLMVTFEGRSAHAGTTPMHLRQDALVGAAEWIAAVERQAQEHAGLVCTVGRVEVAPNASNVIPARVGASLDARHPNDAVRRDAVDKLCGLARSIAISRGLTVDIAVLLDQPAVSTDSALSTLLEQSVHDCGVAATRLVSGAGHDAMILAPIVPAAMLFIRSPGGISHHPDESVSEADVAAALRIGRRFLDLLAESA